MAIIYTTLVEGESVDTRVGPDGRKIKVAQTARGGIKAVVGRRVELVLDPDQVVDLAMKMLGKLAPGSLHRDRANTLLQIVKALT
jgi:hypothetical protein